MNTQLALTFFIILLATSAASFAADKKSEKSPTAEPAKAETSSSEGERMNVENIKEKYWARGDEAEMGVVQNRLYSKALKFDASLFGGFITTDPFLNVKSLGGSVGYHFSEYFSAHVLAWKSYAGGSSALDFFQQKFGVEANTNNPRSYMGTEAAWSFLYGKLSVVGKSIIYYDFHLLGGMGFTDTETGRYFTPHMGVAQQIYLSKTVSMRVDYRLMYYREHLIDKYSPAGTASYHRDIGSRNNWTNSITFGVNFLIGVTK